MMALVAKLLEAALGPWLKALVLPALLVGLVTAVHTAVKARSEARTAREAALVAHGRDQCLSEVQIASAQAEAKAARQSERMVREELNLAKKATDEVEANARRISEQLDDARRSAVADGDLIGRCCISRGVCQSLRDRQGQAGAAGAGGGIGRPGGAPGPDDRDP